jgi:hypothetical protein
VIRARCPFEVDVEASLRLPGSSVADAHGSKCDPQTPSFAVAKGPSGQRISVGANGRWRGLARWKFATSPAYRRRRSASPFRGRIRGQGAWIRAPRPPASAPPPPVAGLEAAGRHQGRWSVGAEAPRAATPSHCWIKAGNHRDPVAEGKDPRSQARCSSPAIIIFRRPDFCSRERRWREGWGRKSERDGKESGGRRRWRWWQRRPARRGWREAFWRQRRPARRGWREAFWRHVEEPLGQWSGRICDGMCLLDNEYQIRPLHLEMYTAKSYKRPLFSICI